MSNRMVRVNSLVQREISHIIHTQYQSESVTITITEVKIMPDLRTGKVFYSVLGGEEQIKDAKRFFKRYGGRIKFQMGKAIILKYTPDIKFIYDDSYAKGTDLIYRMNEIETESKPIEDPAPEENE